MLKMQGPPGTVNINGLNIYFDDASLEATVISYVGRSRYVEIPSSIVRNMLSYTVTGIADGAFADSGSITVDVPYSILSVGCDVFHTYGNVKVHFRGTHPLLMCRPSPSALTPSDVTDAYGYYLPEFATEWESVLDGAGKWNGLIMGLGVTQSGEVSVPFSWLAKYDLVDGADYEAAATNLTMKGIPAWQEYVAGTDPTDATDFFHIKGLTFSNGIPVFEWEPDLGMKRDYTVEWTPDLTTTNVIWKDMDAIAPGETNSPFFRVKVGMPE